MQATNRLRLNSVFSFFFSFALRAMYNAFVFFYPHFSLTQKTILHLVLAVASVVFGWLALQYYKKAIPTGSNLGCLYYFFLLLNLVGGVGAVFFGLVQVFSAEGGSSETLWLL